MASTADVGLCLSCRWMRKVVTRRGSTFLRCGRAETDPRFARYPALPVLACPGFEAQPDERPGVREPEPPP